MNCFHSSIYYVKKFRSRKNRNDLVFSILFYQKIIAIQQLGQRVQLADKNFLVKKYPIAMFELN